MAQLDHHAAVASMQDADRPHKAAARRLAIAICLMPGGDVMAASPRILTADTFLVWDGVTVFVRKGTMADIQPGSPPVMMQSQDPHSRLPGD